jgi:hypothetical protein
MGEGLSWLSVLLIAVPAVSGVLAIASVVLLRLTRRRWLAKAEQWHMDRARSIVLQVVYADGATKVIVERKAGEDEETVRALDHAVRDLSTHEPAH